MRSVERAWALRDELDTTKARVMSAAYAGEGKTDAKDAYVIAETALLRILSVDAVPVEDFLECTLVRIANISILS